MEWLEITVNTTPEKIDALSETLEELGVTGLIVEDTATYTDFLENNRQYWDYIDETFQKEMQNVCRLKFYVENSDAGRQELDRLQAALPAERMDVCTVQDADWENNWKEFYKPIPVGERFLIVPMWEETENPENRCILKMDPGLIFGTGSHATTQMCLRGMESWVHPGHRVLDLGCGSGILAIAALLLGAAQAVGCDIDPLAPDVARENAACNGLSAKQFPVYAGNILTDRGLQQTLKKQQYDVIFANIVADVIIALAPQIPDLLLDTGVFLCSGIINGRETEVADALKQAGLEILHTEQQDDWYCYHTKKQGT